ncbi:hypothetical protein ASC77_01795 [Nocardioides sp. Root1257]|nr:hypothetical protein ASC77_01795 [Nocardioides sp. Root1257]KRC56520.1 hypothetical protein ASE24_01795 [Nocardioides sp. Root224]
MDAEEQRVLGSLLEKQVTVPASYPLSLNALRTACNQSNSRDPVTDYDEHTVEQAGRRLKDRGLLRIVWSDTGRRTLKYHQTLDEVLGLADDERALLTVLLLRGPQAPGELRSRTERLHAFADRDAAADVLRRMAERGLVRELPRRGGDRDNRWMHLLGAEPAAETPAPTVDVLVGGAEARDDRVRTSYDAVAASYADHLVNEVSGLPFERWLLDRVAAHADGGPVVEVGCGPGHITAYLADAGADATGIDLSAGMVAQARERYPDGSYEVGDLRRLMRPTSAPGWSAVLAWYSLIHLAAAELPAAVDSLVRPLAPGGWLVVAVHAGTEVRHHDEWFDVPVELDFVYHEPEQVVGLVRTAGLEDVEWYRRGPVESRGETSQRLYVVARKPS